jgi:hypothetical protein
MQRFVAVEYTSIYEDVVLVRFFKRRPTASWDMLSIYCNSTALSASSRKDHRDRPLGGVLQPRAMIFASTSPVILGLTGGVSRFFLCTAASKPVSEYLRLIVWTVLDITVSRGH